MLAAVWGALAEGVGLSADASAIWVAALYGMTLAPDATERVELRGRVLCYPARATEADLRRAVMRWMRVVGCTIYDDACPNPLRSKGRPNQPPPGAIPTLTP
jgi:hypothetical protein